MIELDVNAKKIAETLLNDLIKVNQFDNSIKYFRKDLVRMVIWLYIMSEFSKKQKINIEDISREIAQVITISKPSLRLILENAKDKGFLKFTHNQEDTRSWMIEPESITIEEFNAWTKKIRSLINE